MLIYIAHPYTKDPEGNMKKADLLLKTLATHNPQHTFISPLHIFSRLAGIASEKTIMEHCKRVIKKCDGVIFAEEWETSEGCKEEMKYCQEIGMRYSVIESGGRIKVYNAAQ